MTTVNLNFESKLEREIYEKVVKLCNAPLGFIQETIWEYDLWQWTPKYLAKEIEKQYKAAMK